MRLYGVGQANNEIDNPRNVGGLTDWQHQLLGVVLLKHSVEISRRRPIPVHSYSSCRPRPCTCDEQAVKQVAYTVRVYSKTPYTTKYLPRG